MPIPTVRFSGLDEALSDIDARLAALKAGVRESLDEFGKAATAEMIRTHTFQNRTFRLEDSIGYHLTEAWEGHWVLGVFASAPYASQVEEGHPGPPPARPYPFFWPVFYAQEPGLWDTVTVTVHAALGGETSLGRAVA